MFVTRTDSVTEVSSASSVISLRRCWRKEEDEEVLDRDEGEEARTVERPRALSDNSCAAAKEKTVSYGVKVSRTV